MNISDYDKYDTVVDPCPRCGAAVEGYESKPEYVRSNREAVVSINNPYCPHETDPEADCICHAYVNPHPNPALDRHVMVAECITLTPCGCYFRHTEEMGGDWKITRTVKPDWHARQIARLREDAAKLGVTIE